VDAEQAPDPSLVAMAQGEIQIPGFVRLRMGRGFYMSVDAEERDERRPFWRTIRGAYVRADQVSTNEPPTHRGVVVGGAWQLPIGFVYRGGTRRLRRVAATQRFRNAGTLERHTPVVAAETLQRNGQDYIVTADGFIVRRNAIRLAEPSERPSEVGEDERWIDVDLSEQILVAYEGDRPVFVTTVSTGREGHDTPLGLFQIKSKHVSTTMDDLDAGEESYLIEDVPWTMYFEGNYAMHAAFWHSGFGRVRSHGCVNLAPADARWVFQWSLPMLPASWHGVFSERGRPGTWIRIRE
jgi:lipoprotein-anchoring transpeptidase ErfK/SrfK